MIERNEVQEIVRTYDKPRIRSFRIHSALKIFHGAKLEGLKTIGICTPRKNSGETNLYPTGSPYAYYYSKLMSTGRRIALDIKKAWKTGQLDKVTC